ncbi:MAG TPA: NYN domain-containing protein [Terriglobales bacterium]|nr:NYN domain-containing protein [Terriglobales bacterium]
MGKVYCFVDGFNLYHALDANPAYHPFKWLSLTTLAKCFVLGKDLLAGVEYFTTLATWNPAKVERHKLFIKINEAEGVKVIYGEFKRKDRRCPECGEHIRTFEEKQTDVNIAIRLFELAVQDQYDKAIIISGDTDLIPAVKAVQKTFPAKKVGIVLPISRASEDLKKQVDFHHKMRIHHLEASRFPDKVVLSESVCIECPNPWRRARAQKA